MTSRLVEDESGASTELGYIFTFMLGVLFLSLFSVWAFGLETSTRENWNTTAVDVNMADIAAAVERADLASREDASVSYAEVVTWRLTEADETEFVLTLDDSGGALSTASCGFAHILLAKSGHARRVESKDRGRLRCRGL